VMDLFAHELDALDASPGDVRLGTCVAAADASHSGQKACTLSMKLGAAVNETQADFYWDGCRWMAQPSTSQDRLPFPDPALNKRGAD